MRLDWTTGNRIELLECGEQFFPRVFEAIAQARREVLLETFILFDDPIGRQLQQALLQAARQGAEVHVLVDGWGSPDLTPEFLRPLIDAGVRLRAFEPARFLFGTRINLFRRMHRKLVVVDQRIAFVGGINYSIDQVAGSGPRAKQDYAVQIEGPLVDQVHAFCRASLRSPQVPSRSWRQRWRARRAPAPRPLPHGEAGAALVWRDNAEHRTDIEQQYRAALRGARERAVLANAYFFPGYRLLKEMRRAARRGVQVDLILQGEPDMPIARSAAMLLYAHLVRAGVNVYEYCERPLHAKVASIDDHWATVGSSNLDPTSLGLNLEANVVIRDPAFARHLREHLDTLIERHCRRIALPPAGPLGSAWIQVRSFFVFHFLRRFPTWARWWPTRAPKVELLQADP